MTNIPRTQWKEYLEELSPPLNTSHLIEDDFVILADALCTEDEVSAKEKMPIAFDHMKECELCVQEVHRLINVVETAGGG